MKKVNWLLVLIFLLALGLRVWILSGVPVGFDSDSIDVAYVGKFLALHGRDPAGNILPLAFDKFGDFRPTGLFYLSGITELALGSSVFTVRLVTAFFGAVSIFVIFAFANELFRKREIAYFSSLFLAILPWDIVLSRDVHEAIVGYFFTILGFWLLLRFVRDTKKRKYLLAGAIVLLFSYFFYHGVRTLTPVLLLVLWLFFRSRDLAKVTILFFIVTLAIVFSPYGGGRLGQVAFYKSPGEVKKVQDLPYADTSIAVARVFHNKFVVYGRDLVSTWFEHFSPSFLLFRGGFPERYMVPEAGLIYITMALVAAAGIVYSAKKPKEVGLLVGWLLVSPVQAALTYEDIPSVTRASFMIFPIVILGGVGLWWILGLLKKPLWRKAFWAVFFFLMALETTYFMHQYLVHQRINKGVLRGEGNIEMGRYIEDQRKNYDLVLVPFEDNLPFYFLFYGGHFDSDIKVNIADTSSNSFSYKNVTYLRVGCPSHFRSQYAGKNVLYIDDSWCQEREDFKTEYTFKRADLTEAWVARTSTKSSNN